MKIYISILISNQDEAEVREHASKIKNTLERSGHKVVTPFDVNPGENPEYVDYLVCDLRALHDCDAIFLCSGWQFSRGCRIERNFAEEFLKQIMYENQSEPDSDYYFNR